MAPFQLRRKGKLFPTVRSDFLRERWGHLSGASFPRSESALPPPGQADDHLDGLMPF